MVRVSSQYFPILDCISYSTQEGLRGSRFGQDQQVSIFSLVLSAIQLRKKYVLALDRVSVSSQWLSLGLAPVLDCVSYSWAIKKSCLSLQLGLVVRIFQFGIVYRTVRTKQVVALVMVRVSSQYFPVLDCISYSTQEGCPGSRQSQGQQSVFPSFGLGIIQLSKKATMAPVMVRVSSPNFPVLDCISYSTQEELRGSRQSQGQQSVFSRLDCIPCNYA